MNKNIKISDHLNSLNNIVLEFKTIRIKIDDKDKTLKFIWVFFHLLLSILNKF